MSTPWDGFAPFTNVTLSVDVAEPPTVDPIDNGWVVDPNTGNFVPSSVATGSTPSPIQRLTYRCHMRLSKKSTYNGETGVDTTDFILEGVLIYPWQFDPLIQPNQIFDATFNGKNGKFELLPEESVFPEFKALIGTRLYGVFRMSGSGQTP